jgi:ABC-type microcin C transport system duplicated ATPase subunit YejF
MRLLPEPPAFIAEGSIAFAGLDLVVAGEDRLAAIRGDRIGMVFQNPMTSLDPSFRIGDQIAETILTHERVAPEEAKRRARSCSKASIC